jgi:hypothetical protein
MSGRVDPFLLNFLESVEHELASALEMQHRREDGHGDAEPLSIRLESERIVTLEVAIDALQAALDRGESSTVH